MGLPTAARAVFARACAKVSPFVFHAAAKTTAPMPKVAMKIRDCDMAAPLTEV
jgi:hypothetical protein